MTRTRSPEPRTISALARLIATGLIAAAIGAHVSRGGLLVAGRWSPMYAGLLAVVVAGGMFLAARAWMNRSPERGAATRCADAAALVWGAGYFWGTFIGGEPASRAFSLRLFGSITPAAALLEWVALVLVTAAGLLAVAPRLRGRWRDACLSVGSILAVAVLAEGAFRVRTLVRPTTHGYNTYSNELWYRRYRSLNSLGFRDDEPVRARAPGRRRILLIGDSFAFGNGIDRPHDRFGEQLAARLRDHVGGEWEVINASRGNTNTLDHIGMLSRMLSYHPDLVVLLYVFNDADYLKPRVNRATATLPPDFRNDLTALAILMRNSYLFQETYLRLRIGSYRRLQREGEIINDAYADSALVTRHLADVDRFVTTARAGGAIVRIVPFDIGVVADERLRARDNRFIARADAEGFPLCPITRAFDGHAFNALTVNAMDLHPNEYANALAADAAWACVARPMPGDDARAATAPSTPDSVASRSR